MEILDFNRINDFIHNSDDTEFNFYKQREYIQPSESDIKAVYDYLLYVAVNKYNANLVELIRNQQLKSLIPDNFLKKCDNFNDALKEINNLKSYLSTKTWYNNVFKIDETLKDLFERFESNLCGTSLGGGEKFFSSRLKNDSYHHDQRLYIPCNSEYCHKFAQLIIEKTLKYDLPFEFKIMNVETMQNGSDNIVIYIKKEKLKNYVDMINEIISENPDITFGKTHMFGYQINDYISLAPELGGNSYSGHMKRLVNNMISEYGRTTECSEIIYIIHILI